jgi:hypothetical protein
METDGEEGRSPLGRIAMGSRDGKPVIRGQAVLVEGVLRKLAEWPQLQREDILACLEYAARLVVYRQLRESDLSPAWKCVAKPGN